MAPFHKAIIMNEFLAKNKLRLNTVFTGFGPGSLLGTCFETNDAIKTNKQKELKAIPEING